MSLSAITLMISGGIVGVILTLAIDAALTLWVIKKGRANRQFGEMLVMRFAQLLGLPIMQVPDDVEIVYPEDEDLEHRYEDLVDTDEESDLTYPRIY